jgi:thioredoxin 1
MTSKAKLAAAIIAALVIGIPLAMKVSKSKNASAASIQASQDATCGSSAAVACGPDGKAVATGKLPRFVDLGTTSCAPCKVMIRVMAELSEQYPGALQIDFVNVKEEPEMLDKYGVSIIPTQIFYSPDGKELFRHTGVFPAPAIVAKWKELGYELAPRKEGK